MAWALEDLAVLAFGGQGSDVDRAEDLGRGRELGEQDLPVVRPGEPAGQLAGQGRLSGSRRPQEERVLTGQDGHNQRADDVLTLAEHRRHLADDLAEVCGGLAHLGVSLNHRTQQPHPTTNARFQST